MKQKELTQFVHHFINTVNSHSHGKLAKFLLPLLWPSLSFSLGTGWWGGSGKGLGVAADPLELEGLMRDGD